MYVVTSVLILNRYLIYIKSFFSMNVMIKANMNNFSDVIIIKELVILLLDQVADSIIFVFKRPFAW